MRSPLDLFEQIARLAYAYTDREEKGDSSLHPFDRRNVHPSLPAKVKKLFDDGHYAEATFEAFKAVDKLVQKHSHNRETGEKLMMAVFNPDKPTLALNPLITPSEVDEQRGFRFLFAGGAVGIRNPRGHEVDMIDDVDTCLDHLVFASLLIRRMEQAGFA